MGRKSSTEFRTQRKARRREKETQWYSDKKEPSRRFFLDIGCGEQWNSNTEGSQETCFNHHQQDPGKT